MIFLFWPGMEFSYQLGNHIEIGLVVLTCISRLLSKSELRTCEVEIKQVRASAEDILVARIPKEMSHFFEKRRLQCFRYFLGEAIELLSYDGCWIALFQ